MVWVLDSTLREGEQTPGVYFDKHIKLAIANLLDEVGVDIIEAGHPMVTPEIHAAVKSIAQKGYKRIVGAHSRSLKADVDLALELLQPGKPHLQQTIYKVYRCASDFLKG